MPTMPNTKTQLFIPFLACVLCLAGCQDDKADPATIPSTSESSQTTETIPATANSEGAKLHQEKCAGCHMAPHDAAFYQRPNLKMKSYERLQSQVRLCNANLDLELFDEDMTQIGEFLNESYYKFPVN